MHRPGVVGEEQSAFSQFFDQLFERRFANEIGAIGAEMVGDDQAHVLIFFGAKKNRFTFDRRGHRGKTLRQPPFRWAIFRTGTNPHPSRALRIRSRSDERNVADLGDRA